MKKCLLFLFVFTITISLYSISAKADTTYQNGWYIYEDNYGYACYKVITNFQGWVNSTPDGSLNDNLFYYASGQGVWTHYDTLQDAQTFCLNNQYSTVDYEINSTWGLNDTNAIWAVGIPVRENPNNNIIILPNYPGSPSPTPTPVPNPDIYLCGFFFEPVPDTELYSMYCFPQELDDGEVVTIYYNNLDNIGFEITDSSVPILKRCYLESGSTIEYYHSMEYWLEMIDQIKLENDNVIDFLFTTPIYAIYCDFIENNGNPNYNIFPLTEESWWDDIVNEIGFEDTELGFIWEWLFGDPDNDYHNVTIDNSPSPTPLPTPIPYRTTIVPDGNGGYEFQYEYEDENGNQITASAPPDQPNYDGSALVTQAVNMNISGVPVSDVEGVQSLLNVIGEADADYQEGFQVIGQSFAILPSKWFMFFGIPAAIILIAGIIKSLLG